MKVVPFPKAYNKFCLTCGQRCTAQQEDLLFFLCSDERCKEGGIGLLVTQPSQLALRSAVVDLFDDMEKFNYNIKLATFIGERTTELLNVSLSYGL